MQEMTHESDGLNELQDGDRVLFADRKEPLTVENLTRHPETDDVKRVNLKGPRGGSVEVYVDDDQLIGPNGPIDALKVEQVADDEPLDVSDPKAVVRKIARQAFGGVGADEPELESDPDPVNSVDIGSVPNIDGRERVCVHFAHDLNASERHSFSREANEYGGRIDYWTPATNTTGEGAAVLMFLPIERQ